mmetsp:Transcript_39627/g.93845  ORF Transcript_39627/g.93845 Transcript_39627/m.93845 type:complete len:224 (+) Transcript_39627:868-1539(+)
MTTPSSASPSQRRARAGAATMRRKSSASSQLKHTWRGERQRRRRCVNSRMSLLGTAESQLLTPTGAPRLSCESTSRAFRSPTAPNPTPTSSPALHRRSPSPLLLRGPRRAQTWRNTSQSPLLPRGKALPRPRSRPPTAHTPRPRRLPSASPLSPTPSKAPPAWPLPPPPPPPPLPTLASHVSRRGQRPRQRLAPRHGGAGWGSSSMGHASHRCCTERHRTRQD